MDNFLAKPYEIDVFQSLLARRLLTQSSVPPPFEEALAALPVHVEKS